MGRLEDLKLKIEEARAGRMEKVGATTVPPQKPAIYSQARPEVYVPIGLRAIGLNESDGGKYLDHPLVKTGQMAGERAGGVYGMMPLTFRDVVNSDATLKSEYGPIASLSTDEITKALNEDTRMAKAAAVKYYEHLSADFHNDHIRVAYAWNHGPGCVKGRPDSALLKDSYVQDYMRHYVKELARDKTLWRKELEPKLEDLHFKPAVVTGNGEMALTKADRDEAIGERDWTKIKGPAEALKFEHPVNGETGKPIEGAFTRANTEHGQYRKWNTGNLYYERKPRDEHDLPWNQHLSDSSDPERLTQAAHAHHVMRHYNLNVNDRLALKQAFPNRGLHEYIGVHPDTVRSELDRAHKSYNMNKALAKAELQKMAIKDLRAGEKKSSTEHYDIHDYDHLLKPEHVKAGYGLTVWQQRKGVRSSGAPDVKAVVTHKGMPVGRVIGHVHDTGVGYPGKYHSLTPHSEIDKEHRGKGLGLASYEALYAHAKHKMGVTQIDGGEHTNDAGRVHEALASKHGLSYKGKLYHHDADGLVTDRAPYRYALKSEEEALTDSEILEKKKIGLSTQLKQLKQARQRDYEDDKAFEAKKAAKDVGTKFHQQKGSEFFAKPHALTSNSPNPASKEISSGFKNARNIGNTLGYFSNGTLVAHHPKYGEVRLKPDNAYAHAKSQATHELAAHDVMHHLGLGKHMHHVGLTEITQRDKYQPDFTNKFSVHQSLKNHKTLGQYHNSTRQKSRNLPSTESVLKHHEKSGDLHRLGVADYIMGNTDRHAHNVMVHQSQPKSHPLQMIDHGLNFESQGEFQGKKKTDELYYPTYLRHIGSTTPEHHEKLKSWVNSIDANKIHKHLINSGLHPAHATGVKARIHEAKKAFQNNVDSTEALRDLWGGKTHLKNKKNPETYNTFGETVKPLFHSKPLGQNNNLSED